MEASIQRRDAMRTATGVKNQVIAADRDLSALLVQRRDMAGVVDVPGDRLRSGFDRFWEYGKVAHPIYKDEACLGVKDSAGSKHSYCQESAEGKLDLAADDLAALRSARHLGGPR